MAVKYASVAAAAAAAVVAAAAAVAVAVGAKQAAAVSEFVLKLTAVVPVVMAGLVRELVYVRVCSVRVAACVSVAHLLVAVAAAAGSKVWTARPAKPR